MLLMEVRLRVLGAGYRRCRCCPKALPGALAANLASRREVGWEVGSVGIGSSPDGGYEKSARLQLDRGLEVQLGLEASSFEI